MDKVPFSLTPELNLGPRFEEDCNQIRMDDVDQTQLSQYPLMDYESNRNSPGDEMLGRQTSGVVDDDRQLDWTGMSEGPLTTRSLIDISIYVPDDNDDSNDNNNAVASSHVYNSPSSSSSAYFSLLDEAAKDGSNSNSWRNNYDVHLPPARMEPHGTAFVNSQRRFPIQPPVRPLISCSESSTVTLKNETTDDVSGLPEIYLQPSRRDYDSNVKIEDKSQSGATDDDVVDWPSDHEEGDYLELNLREENFKSLNFKDKPRGEPMGSEDILTSTGSSATAYNNLFGGYRSSGYEQDIGGQLSSDNEKFSGESSDEIDLDLNRSYWLRGNIEGADNNLPLPVLGPAKNCVLDDEDEDEDDVRPPLVGQSEENNDLASLQPILDDLIIIEQEVEAGNYNDILMEFDGTQSVIDDRLLEAAENLSDQDLNRNDSISANHRVLSPSVLSVSSVASSKRLEWDSGADIGYGGPKVTYGLSSLERMAIGCSALKKRMEPEGKSSLVNTGPPLVPPSVQIPSVTTNQTDEEPIVPKEQRNVNEVEIFKNVLVLRNSAFRSASLSDLSPNRKYDRSAKQHSSSTTDIYGNCPIGPVKLISSSSCSAVSTCSSNTVIGIPCISGEGSVASPFDNLSVVTVVKGSGDGDHDGLTSQPPSAPPPDVQQQVDSSAGKVVVEPESKSPNVEKVEPKDLVAFTKRFVEQLCTDSDEKRKSSLVKKILEDFGVVSDVSSSPSASSLSVPIPPPPPAFEDSAAPQIAVVQEWERSLGSAAYHSPSSLILGSRIGIRNEGVDVTVRDSDSSLNTVKEMQQQIASSFEYYDPSKSEKNDRKSFASSVGNSSVDNVAWVKLLNKKKKQTVESKRFERHRHSTRPHVMETSDDETCSSNRDFLLKFSSLRKPPSLYSSDSTGSDYQVRGPNPIDTMKRFIRRLEVVDSWHPEGVELIKELIQKQRRSYIRRLQREVDWLERIERVLSVNPSRETAKHGFKDDLESQMNLIKNNGYEKPKKTVGKVTKKDFSQCYPTPVSTDLEVSCDRSIPKVRRCSIGIQTSRWETVASPVQFSNAEVWSSPVQNPGRFVEKERPVVSVPLSKASQTHLNKQQRKSVVTSTKDRVQSEKQAARSVAWFLPFGNGQPKLLLGGRRGIADGQRSGSPDTRLTGGKKQAWVSKATSPFALQEAFKLLKASAIKRSESRQMKLKMEAELRRRIGLVNREIADNQPEKVFHRVTVPLQISSQHHRPQKRIISHFEMREQTEKIYNVLPEITEKNEVKIRQNIYRTNRQMAAMFRKKLQEKVLKGQVSHLTTQKCS